MLHFNCQPKPNGNTPAEPDQQRRFTQGLWITRTTQPLLSWKGTYEEERTVDPGGTTDGSDRVMRGGGWPDFARLARSAYRSRDVPGDRYSCLGFRLLSSASQVKQQAEREIASQTEEPRDEVVEKRRTQ